MTTIRHEVTIDADPAAVWDAARDIGALHTRLVPGFVRDTRPEAGAAPPVRVVTFANGLELRETIVACDDAARRLVWTAEGAGFDHHNGALQVFAGYGGQTHVIWTADLLPDSLAEAVSPLMAQGLATMARHLGRTV